MSAADDFLRQLTEEVAKKEAEKQALIEEFTRSIPADWTAEDIKEKTKEALADAWARIRKTINDDENPALAYRAAKDIFDIGIGRVAISDANTAEGELAAMLKKLEPKTSDQKVIEQVIENERTKNSDKSKDA